MNRNPTASSSKVTLDILAKTSYIYCRSGRDGESVLQFQRDSDKHIRAEKRSVDLNARLNKARSGVQGEWVSAKCDGKFRKGRKSKTYILDSGPPKIGSIPSTEAQETFEFGTALNDDVIGTLAEFGAEFPPDRLTALLDPASVRVSKRAKTWHKIPCVRSMTDSGLGRRQKSKSIKSIGLSRRRNKTVNILPLMSLEAPEVPVAISNEQGNIQQESEEIRESWPDSDGALSPPTNDSRWDIRGDLAKMPHDLTLSMIDDFDITEQDIHNEPPLISTAPASLPSHPPEVSQIHINPSPPTHVQPSKSPTIHHKEGQERPNDYPPYLFELLMASTFPLPPIIPPPKVLVNLRHMDEFPRPLYVCKKEHWAELADEARWGYWQIDMLYLHSAQDLKYVWDTLVKLAGPGKFGPLQVQLTLNSIRLSCQVRQALIIRQILRAVLRNFKDYSGLSAVLHFFGDTNDLLVKA